MDAPLRCVFSPTLAYPRVLRWSPNSLETLDVRFLKAVFRFVLLAIWQCFRSSVSGDQCGAIAGAVFGSTATR